MYWGGRDPSLSSGHLDLSLWYGGRLAAFPVCPWIPSALHYPYTYNCKETRLDFTLPRKRVFYECPGYRGALKTALEHWPFARWRTRDCTAGRKRHLLPYGVRNLSAPPDSSWGARRLELRIQEKIGCGGAYTQHMNFVWTHEIGR